LANPSLSTIARREWQRKARQNGIEDFDQLYAETPDKLPADPPETWPVLCQMKLKGCEVSIFHHPANSDQRYEALIFDKDGKTIFPEELQKKELGGLNLGHPVDMFHFYNLQYDDIVPFLKAVSQLRINQPSLAGVNISGRLGPIQN
jgi:hypothetical protein